LFHLKNRLKTRVALIELLDLSGIAVGNVGIPTCFVYGPNLARRASHSGMTINPPKSLGICYVVNQPGQSSEMLEERRYSASLTLNRTHIWITGGNNGNGYLQTSEFVSIGQPSVKGPDLSYAVAYCCLVGVNSSTALLCGGYNGGTLNECHYMNLEDLSWSQGPSMMTKRRLHSCGIFKSAAHQGRNVVIAAGGYNLDSVEFLDPTTNTWNEGKIYIDFNYIICVCYL
jgi:hypothetical protein